jgi:uncharacterized protein YmfQ (DUF2313 family)
MSLTPNEHALLLGRLLPQGPVWATSDQTNNADALHRLLAAMAQEPARVGAAYDLILEELIPDNVNTDLVSWERIVGAPAVPLTDPERLDRIRAILNGNAISNREELQAFLHQLTGNPDVRLYHRAGAPFAAGVCNAGDSLWVGEWDYTYAVEFMAQVLDSDKKDFAAWSGFTSVNNNAADSPTTLDHTAATAQLATVPATQTLELLDPAAQSVYASLWVRNPSATARGFELTYMKRDGTISSPKTVTLQGNVWHKVTYEQPIGVGPMIPALRIRYPGGTAAVELDACVVGVRSPLEQQAREAFPIHTHGIFGVIGEYADVLGTADQLKVMW